MSAEKPIRSRWRRILWTLVFSLLLPALLALTVVAVFWVRSGESFRLKEWTVIGSHLADRRLIVKEMEAVRGKPLAMIRLDSLRLGLLRDPWIAGLRLTRNWPDALSVVMVEEEPLAWVMRNDRVRCLTASGRLLGLPQSGVALDMPVVQGPVRDLAELAGRLTELKQDFPEIYRRTDALTWNKMPVLRLKDCAMPVLFQAADWRHGLTLLQVVISRRSELLQRQGELDLRFTNQVVIRSSNV